MHVLFVDKWVKLVKIMKVGVNTYLNICIAFFQN